MEIYGKLLVSTALLIVVVVAGDAPCPDVCSCMILYRADCINSSLTSVPEGLSNEIRFLNASHNMISALTQLELKGTNVPYIKVLDFSNNKISVIESAALRNLKDLIFLYLSRNDITLLDEDVFEFNPRLEFLKLDGNFLDLPVRRPFLNVPSLKSLDLASCNIRYIPELTFVKVQNLEELRLSHNRMKILNASVFLSVKHLKYLYLSDNLLKELPADLFVSLNDLVTLDLSNNQLQVLHPQVFTVLERLEHLDISRNKLKMLEIGLFTPLMNLKTLHLHKNLLDRINQNQFYALNSLSLLDLSGNHLTDLHFRIICDLHNLTYLKVSNNRMICDCALWQLWSMSVENGVRILSTCEEPGFEFTVEKLEEFRKNNTCNTTICELEVQDEFPEDLITPLYLYVIAGVGLLLVSLVCCIVIWILIRYRKEICKRRTVQVSSIGYSQNTITYLGRQQTEQLSGLDHNSFQRQLELQQELHRQHQETITRNRLHREQSTSLKTLPKREPQNIRHSYHEQRLPSFPEEDRAWFNADTLPSNNRTSVFLSSRPREQGSNVRKARPLSEPRFKESSPKWEPSVLEVNSSTPKSVPSVLCSLPNRNMVLDVSSSGSDVVPEDSFENKRL
ncbi:hypothetical protein C0J52_26084 [Blattella germanica]|nr:hypothetical protein C0J52_26084 [Blattella germanica]